MSLETFYPVSPPQPLWVHACYEKIKDLKPKRLPLSDVQMFEMFKKRYGTKQAIKLKVNVNLIPLQEWATPFKIHTPPVEDFEKVLPHWGPLGGV